MKEHSHRKPLWSICRKLEVTKAYCFQLLWLHHKFLQNLVVANNHLLCSVGQEFGQCTAGRAWLCFTMSGALDGRITSLGLESPAGSFIPMSGGWCWLWTETLAVDVSWILCMVASSCHLASSQNGGWISQVSIPRESQLYRLLCPSLGNHTVSLLRHFIYSGS